MYFCIFMIFQYLILFECFVYSIFSCTFCLFSFSRRYFRSSFRVFNHFWIYRVHSFPGEIYFSIRRGSFLKILYTFFSGRISFTELCAHIFPSRLTVIHRSHGEQILFIRKQIAPYKTGISEEVYTNSAFDRAPSGTKFSSSRVTLASNRRDTDCMKFNIRDLTFPRLDTRSEMQSFRRRIGSFIFLPFSLSLSLSLLHPPFT